MYNTICIVFYYTYFKKSLNIKNRYINISGKINNYIKHLIG